MEIKQYWNIIRKRLWMIVLLIIVSCTASAVYSIAVIEPQYQASTKLIVNPSNQTVSGNVDMQSISTSIQLIKTYKEIIRTPRIMDEVVEQYPELEATTSELISKVSVNSVNETQVMSVMVVDDSYERAAQIANAVSKVFQSEIPLLLKVDNVNILNEADPQSSAAPISPNTRLNIAISFVLSVMIGLGLTFLLEYLDDTVKTEKEVSEWLGVPALAVIPRVKSKDMTDSKSVPASKRIRSEKNVTLDA
ncbi:YveK family protein [Marinicrinis lubricantis]|uniref:YveK family protein n=1 Tax=Marinicrinis lubricantis TaxID=2086470 RepID=A0ABW1IJW0_9BACL